MEHFFAWGWIEGMIGLINQINNIFMVPFIKMDNNTIIFLFSIFLFIFFILIMQF